MVSFYLYGLMLLSVLEAFEDEVIIDPYTQVFVHSTRGESCYKDFSRIIFGNSIEIIKRSTKTASSIVWILRSCI